MCVCEREKTVIVNKITNAIKAIKRQYYCLITHNMFVIPYEPQQLYKQ